MKRMQQLFHLRVEHGPFLMGSHRFTCHPHVLYVPARAEPHLDVNLHAQFSTADTRCLLIATHFTDPRQDDRKIACVKLECATGS